jgi:hypothetical protein
VAALFSDKIQAGRLLSNGIQAGCLFFDRIRWRASGSRGQRADGLTGEQLLRRQHVDGLIEPVHGFFFLFFFVF